MPTTLRIALLAGLLALLSSLAVIGFIYVRTHDEAVASLHRQVAEQSKVLTDVYRQYRRGHGPHRRTRPQPARAAFWRGRFVRPAG